MKTAVTAVLVLLFPILVATAAATSRGPRAAGPAGAPPSVVLSSPPHAGRRKATATRRRRRIDSHTRTARQRFPEAPLHYPRSVILENGVVRTLDPSLPRAAALAVAFAAAVVVVAGSSVVVGRSAVVPGRSVVGGAVVVGGECYLDRGWEAEPVSVLHPSVSGVDHTGVLAVHSLSKRSNLAGYRVGFVAGDPRLVAALLEALGPLAGKYFLDRYLVPRNAAIPEIAMLLIGALIYGTALWSLHRLRETWGSDLEYTET